MKKNYPSIAHGMKSLMAAVICLVALGTLLGSCDDCLTDEPRTQMTPEEAFNSVERLKNNALLTVYNYIGGHDPGQGLQGTDRGVYDLNSFTTDEQILPIRGSDWYDGGLWLRLFFHTWTAGEAPLKNAWNYLFKVVILCNEGIEHIDAFHTTKSDEQQHLTAYRAELRALRAMFYFYLMDLFGRVPLVTSTAVKSNELTLASRSELFYWIYREFNEALPYLRSEKSQQPNTEFYGRITTHAAYFVMMKLALNAEIYTDDDWTDGSHPDGKDIRLATYNWLEEDTTEGNAWQTVMLIKSLVGQDYMLSDNYSNNFDVNNETSKENIFIIPMDPLHYANHYDYFVRSRHYCHGAALGGKGNNGACATISTIRAFGYDQEGDLDWDTRFFLNFYFENVFIGDKQIYEDDGVTPLYYHPLAVMDFDLSTSIHQKTAGARMAKYSADATSRDDARLGNNDIVLFRYADVLLMYAEAAYRLGLSNEALDALNKVYYRANLKTLDDIDYDVLLCERLKELMWEGWRRNDLIRFRRFHLSYDLKDNSLFEADAHTTVFPIPADMMKMHPTWKQNPGY